MDMMIIICDHAKMIVKDILHLAVPLFSEPPVSLDEEEVDSNDGGVVMKWSGGLVCTLSKDGIVEVGAPVNDYFQLDSETSSSLDQAQELADVINHKLDAMGRWWMYRLLALEAPSGAKRSVIDILTALPSNCVKWGNGLSLSCTYVEDDPVVELLWPDCRCLVSSHEILLQHGEEFSDKDGVVAQLRDLLIQQQK